MTANMWDDSSSTPPSDDLSLRINQVAGAPGDDPGSFRILLDTTRGPIQCMFHPVEGGTGAVVCVGGAMGGIDGPADRLYARLPERLAPANVSVLRVEYRQPNNFEECVMDALAGCSFLSGIGAEEIVLLGHSFGAAVVISAAALSPRVRAVASLSPQLYGTREVHNLGKPLLLVHGTADTILDSQASEDIYSRAADPRRIVLYEGAGHSLIQVRNRLTDLLAEWLPARLLNQPMESGRSEYIMDDNAPAEPTA